MVKCYSLQMYNKLLCKKFILFNLSPFFFSSTFIRFAEELNCEIWMKTILVKKKKEKKKTLVSKGIIISVVTLF